jgi:hypothetical protein
LVASKGCLRAGCGGLSLEAAMENGCVVLVNIYVGNDVNVSLNVVALSVEVEQTWLEMKGLNT